MLQCYTTNANAINFLRASSEAVDNIRFDVCCLLRPKSGTVVRYSVDYYLA